MIATMLDEAHIRENVPMLSWNSRRARLSANWGRTRAVLALLGLLAIACAGSVKPYQSNVALLRVEDTTHRILSKDTGAPFTGSLVASEREIMEVARALLDDDTYGMIMDTNTVGLVLVASIKDGIADGGARLFVDLTAAKGRPELARVGPIATAIARAKSPTFTLAEATFKAGKLEGTATAYFAGAMGQPAVMARATFVGGQLSGEAVAYYESTTQLRQKRRFAQGKPTGPQTTYYRNGQVESEMTYLAGTPHGPQREFYGNGVKRAARTYRQGNMIGVQLWYPSGQIERDEVVGETRREWHSNGQPVSEPRHGVIETFYPSGSVQTRTEYADGLAHGAFEERYSDGRRWKAGQYVRGKWEGQYQEWWKNGRLALEATYAQGLLVGAYRKWYADGSKWEAVTYVGGKRDGAYRKWWKNGKPAHVYDYKAGKLEGEYRQYYDTGATWAVGQFVNGKPRGPMQRWFPDGKLGYIMNHEDGIPHGPYKRWWSDGKPRLEAAYERGSLNGDFKNWLEDGTLYESAVYKDGMSVSSSRQSPGWD